MEISREIRLLVRHFAIGSFIEYSWFRGVVVGINANKLTQHVRVTEVLRQAPNRAIGSVLQVPFNCGREVNRSPCENARQTIAESTNEVGISI